MMKANCFFGVDVEKDYERSKELWRITTEAVKEHNVKFDEYIHPLWIEDTASKRIKWLRTSDRIIEFIVMGLPLDIPDDIYKEFVEHFLGGLKEGVSDWSPETQAWIDSHRRKLVPVEKED